MENKYAPISVVIPAYNVGPFLKETIGSVLNQTVLPSEIILVDDGSKDNTARVAKSFGEKVKYIHQENKGCSAARNSGIRAATCEFFAFLDGDDLWELNKLEIQLKTIQGNPDMDILFTYMQNFFSPHLTEVERQRYQAPMHPMAGYGASSFFARRESVLKVGDFNETIKFGDFLDWLSRARDIGLKDKMLEDVLVRRRIHGDNLTLREKNSQGDYLKVVREAIARRKKKHS